MKSKNTILVKVLPVLLLFLNSFALATELDGLTKCSGLMLKFAASSHGVHDSIISSSRQGQGIKDSLSVPVRKSVTSKLWNKLVSGKESPEYVDIEILGRRVSDVQKRDLAESIATKKVNLVGEQVIIISPSHILDGALARRSHGDVVHRPSALDWEVLKRSAIDHDPHEVHGVRALDKHGNILAESFSHGGSHTISSTLVELDFDLVFDQLRRKKLWSQVYSIESSHSHPTYDFFLSKNETGVQQPLSGHDIELGTLLAQQVVPEGKIFKLSAVVPNGYSYSQFFYNGSDSSSTALAKFDLFKDFFKIFD